MPIEKGKLIEASDVNNIIKKIYNNIDYYLTSYLFGLVLDISGSKPVGQFESKNYFIIRLANLYSSYTYYYKIIKSNNLTSVTISDYSGTFSSSSTYDVNFNISNFSQDYLSFAVAGFENGVQMTDTLKFVLEIN